MDGGFVGVELDAKRMHCCVIILRMSPAGLMLFLFKSRESSVAVETTKDLTECWPK